MSDQPFQIKEYAECVNLLNDFFQGDINKVSAWMNCINPHLGNTSPFYLFQCGRGHKVLAFVKGALEDNELESKFKGSDNNKQKEGQ